MTTIAPTLPPGLAGRRITELADRVHLCGMYDAHGAAFYDDLAAADAFEIREIAAAVRITGGPVLDLAAGAGRFTLPLLSLGHEVTALDLSSSMLSKLEERLATIPPPVRRRCTVILGDMADFRLGRRFAHIILGTTSLSLLDAEGRVGLYRSVAEHLTEDGHFTLSVIERGDVDGPTEVCARVQGLSGTSYDLYEYWPTDAPTRRVTIIPADASSTVTVATDEVNTLSRAQVEAELAAASFQLVGHRELPGTSERHRITLLTAVSSR
ncbi:class I SAM-dependent methyltransferase [Streptomyces sp. TRM66268-LWL]|uniref:Class I SAM-dependent methyltransferase n=1 Tax=Streptomyces polyasparticus TaxID=2767826 RepID=A0ABR7SVT6_9ACTN|nr:daptide-type RiPP biosynthesis methyltransferase [Streptomyces polyasparticus]MBC9718884.1 class I SAM-dependent methyltransferase [Streptomyces polyasparticus]